MTKQLAQPNYRRLGIRTDDRERRLVVITDRSAFAQELRLEADVEIAAVFLSRLLLEDRPQHVFDCARYQRGTEHEDVAASFPTHSAAKLVR